MSILGKIMGAIFGGKANAAPASAPAAASSSPASSSIGGSSAGTPAPSAQASQASPGVAQPQTASGGEVDVAEILDSAVKSKGQKLEWRTSIVDLMKALDLDSSLSARKELAQELHYTGDTNDSAAMNVWLHKQVVAKLKENGGKVPADLKD